MHKGEYGNVSGLADEPEYYGGWRGSDARLRFSHNEGTYHRSGRVIEHSVSSYGSRPKLKSCPTPYIPFGYFEIFYPFYEMKHGQIVGMVM